MFKTIAQNAESLVVEKKSKFIGNVYYIETIEEAEKIIERTKKKYHDARHNCYAYRIIEEDRIVEKQSDDGEPSGTAGAPMLNILIKKNLNNVLIIVTRYFGGILLGTGGLVKAYLEASLGAIEKAKEAEKETGYIVEVMAEYDKQPQLEYICEKNNIKIVKKEYTEKIKNLVEISKEKYEKIFKEKNKNGEYNFENEIKQKKYI